MAQPEASRWEPFRRFRHELRDVARAGTPAHAHLRGRLLTLLVVTAAVDAIGSVVVWLFEHGAPGTDIRNFGDAMFWTSAQLLTVSSQFHTPITTGGKVTDIFLMAYAISIVAALAGSYGAFFFRRGIERDPLS